MIELRKSPVRFDEEAHEYWLGEKQLQGVTGIVSRQLGEGDYALIPKEVLAKAAEYGSLIHGIIEMEDSFGTKPEDSQNDVYRAYRALLAENGIVRVANEYLVSDEETYASCIDLVGQEVNVKGKLKSKNVVDLVDFKTTSKIYNEKVALQLSIYAYLFELQNPNLKVGRLFVCWLPKPQYGAPTMKELGRIDNETIAKVLECDKAGEVYPFPVAEQSEQLVLDADYCANIAKLLRQIEEAQEAEKRFKEELLEQMRTHGVQKIDNDYFSVTLVAASEAKSTDWAALKAAHPEVGGWEQDHQKVTKRKESIRIKLK